MRYPTKTSTKEFFCNTIAASIARYEKYRYWASKSLALRLSLCLLLRARQWLRTKDISCTGIHSLGATGREVLRGRSASERVSQREGFRGFSLEVFRGFQRCFEVFQRPSQRPSQSAIFLSELRVVLPLIMFPLKTPTIYSKWTRRVWTANCC